MREDSMQSLTEYEEQEETDGNELKVKDAIDSSQSQSQNQNQSAHSINFVLNLNCKSNNGTCYSKDLETETLLLLQESKDDMTNHNSQDTFNQNMVGIGAITNGMLSDLTKKNGIVNESQQTIIKRRNENKLKDHQNNLNGNNLENGFLLQKEETTEFEKIHNKSAEKNRKLLKLEEMPVHLQFNKYVHDGYREIQNVYGCIKSLFYFHNETVNIITHAIPIVFIIWYYTHMWPWDEVSNNIYFTLLGWSHIFGSISPWLGSVIYHLFMNHHLGARLYKVLLQVDMFGIWMTQCFGALTNLTASTWCLPPTIQATWMIVYGVLSLYGLYRALTAWSPLARRMCFTYVVISRMLGFVIRLATGSGNPDVLIHVILQDVISVAGGMIGVIRIPEKWFPGKLDMCCNSHHIMHVLVVWAVIHMNQASNGDIRWILQNYSRSQCPAIF